MAGVTDPVSQLEALLADLAGSPVELERPGDAEHGDYATNVALKLAGLQKRPPREIAEEIAAQAVERGLAERAEAAGPGFVNLWLADAWIAEGVRAIVSAEAFGGGSATERERIQVEMVSANPTGPITVASARNGAYGDSVARLLEFAGHEVEREYYYNDAGVQMERFRASVDAVRRGEEPPEDGYQGEYIVRARALDGDPVPAMLERIEATLERFRVNFDTWTRRPRSRRRFPDAVALLDTYEEDGAVWARTICARRRQGPRARPLGRSAHVLRQGRRLHPAQVRAEASTGSIYVLGADHHGYVGTPAGARRDARAPARVGRGAHLPARPPRRGRRGEEDVEAARRRRLPRRAHGRDRRRRCPLVPRLARTRPDDRARRRPGAGADEQEPRLLRPVRACPDRRHPSQRGGVRHGV